MKLKSVISIFGIIVAGFLFTGCGSYNAFSLVVNNKTDCQRFSNKYTKNVDFCEAADKQELINIVSDGPKSMFTISMFNGTTRAALQTAAESTILKKDNYFAFIYPSFVSNFGGSLMNTPEEFLKTCEINALNVLSFNNSPCGLHIKPRSSYVSIATFKEQPYNVTSYHAKSVLQYLKENDLHNPESSPLKLRVYNKK
jgi:hypothetical protein